MWSHNTNRAAAKFYESSKMPAQRVANFRSLLLMFPSVLHRWFLDNFTDASDWVRCLFCVLIDDECFYGEQLAARLRYTRSCAVMSMVGFVLGLGDRHPENMLVRRCPVFVICVHDVRARARAC